MKQPKSGEGANPLRPAPSTHSINNLALNSDKFSPVDDPNRGLIRLSSVDPRLVQWRWPGRLPKGKIVVLDADPGSGKSTMCIDIGARLSTGSAMPDGFKPDRPESVLLLSAEDDLADTVAPRILAAGGDPARFLCLETVTAYDEQDVRFQRPPSLPADIPRIEAHIRDHEVGLVVVDVLEAYLGAGVDSHKNTDIRRVLHLLKQMTERTSATIVLVRHLNKSGGGNAMYRGGGSIGIVGAARVGLLVGKDPDDETRQVLACIKSNVAKMPESLAYRLIDSPDNGCAKIQWEGTVLSSANDLLQTVDIDQRTALDEAVEFLKDALADGPALQTDIMIDAKAGGHTEKTVRRAKTKLGVESKKRQTHWEWDLPACGEAQHDQDAQHFPVGTFTENKGTSDQVGHLEPDVGHCARCSATNVRLVPMFDNSGSYCSPCCAVIAEEIG